MLTPEIKADLVQSARELIAEESCWVAKLAGDGRYVYAAKDVDGEIIEVPVSSPEATRFSLFGAVLRELEARNVTPTASGRRELLDEELEAAIQEICPTVVADAGKPEETRPPLSHAQCVAVLEALRARYVREQEAAQTAVTTRKLPVVHLKDLLAKLENEIPVTPEEVVLAVAGEFAALQERLTQLESATGTETSPAQTPVD